MPKSGGGGGGTNPLVPPTFESGEAPAPPPTLPHPPSPTPLEQDIIKMQSEVLLPFLRYW